MDGTVWQRMSNVLDLLMTFLCVTWSTSWLFMLVPLGSIIYQTVTVNIHYPRSNTWRKDVIADLKAYSVAEDIHSGLQLISSCKDAVQDAISTLTDENDLGVWNWDENHYLGHIKMFPLAWRKFPRSVYKSMGDGSPAREYILTNLYENQKELREAYGNAPK
jgi:hypothetical protein